MTSEAAPSTALDPTISRTMLTVFVIGDVLGAGIYARSSPTSSPSSSRSR
jgi:hypothetical protein